MNAPNANASPSSDVELIYVGDAMCSWCWGFAPVVHRLDQELDIPVRVVNGGLRPGPYAQVLDDQMAGYLGQHWVEVSRVSGQPFDHSFLDRRNGWMFNSELPAIAVTAMRDREAESAIRFFTDIQHAFFAQGTDITDPSEYRPLLADYPVEAGPFLEYLVSVEARRAAWKDFEEARSLGITAYPALLLHNDSTVTTVTRGWQPYEQLAAPLRAYLSGTGTGESAGDSCSINEVG